MALIAKSSYDVYNDLITAFNTTGIPLSSDPTITGMTEIYSRHFGELYTNQERIAGSFRLASAVGNYLDIIAQSYGLERYRTSTIGDLSTSNFRFYLPIGKTARDYTLDKDQPLVIPAGQEIMGGDWVFYTTGPITIHPDANAGYGNITASTRKQAEITGNLLVKHNVVLDTIENIDMSTSPELFCTNDRSIPVLPEIESDESLRLRVSNRVNSMNNTNEQAILLSLKAIGITNASFRKNMFGAGTLGVELLTGDGILADEVLDAAEANIKRIAPYARVIRPEYMACQMCYRIVLNDYTIQDKTISEILTNLNDYFDNMRLGSQLTFDTLVRAATAVNNVKSAKIITMKIDGRRTALTNQLATPTERFILPENSVDFTM